MSWVATRPVENERLGEVYIVEAELGVCWFVLCRMYLAIGSKGEARRDGAQRR